MVNKQHLIKIAAVFAIGVVLYTLRPMPEYALHARTAAGMYETSDINQLDTLDALSRLSTNVEAELISAQAMLDMPELSDQALTQLSHHLGELATLSKSMRKQLVGQFGEERVAEMIKLPDWATETIALSQVLDQSTASPLKTLSKAKHRNLQGNLKWVETSLADLQEMLRRTTQVSATPTASPYFQASN